MAVLAAARFLCVSPAVGAGRGASEDLHIAHSSIGETDAQARGKVPAAFLNHPFAAGALIGSPTTIRQRLVELERAGIQEIILNFPDVLQLDALRFLA